MRKWGKLLIRILSLYYFTKAIIELKSSILLYIRDVEGNTLSFLGIEGLAYYLVNFLVFLILAVLLWVLADKIVTAIIGEDSSDSLNINLHYEQLFGITLFVLGIIFVMDAIPSIVSKIRYLVTVDMQEYSLDDRLEVFILALYPITKLVIGICLIIKNRLHKKVNE